jgi:hypothetical protein
MLSDAHGCSTMPPIAWPARHLYTYCEDTSSLVNVTSTAVGVVTSVFVYPVFTDDDSFATTSPLHTITIIPPGSWNTVLPAGEEPVGDGDVEEEGEVEGDVDGDEDPDGELLGLGGGLDGAGVLAGGVVGGGAVVGGGGGVWLWLDVVRAAGGGGGAGAVELSVAGALGLTVALAEAAEAADADCSLACAETPACEITRGVEPATSCPTRLTAVSVTAVTSAHDIAQPSAIASGRPAQPRSARVNDRRWWRGLEFSGTCLVSASRCRQ